MGVTMRCAGVHRVVARNEVAHERDDDEVRAGAGAKHVDAEHDGGDRHVEGCAEHAEHAEGRHKARVAERRCTYPAAE